MSQNQNKLQNNSQDKFPDRARRNFQKNKRIGIDIGRVIIGTDTDKPALFFSRDYLKAPENPGALQGIQTLCERLGPENIFLVSKCGQAVSEKTRDWLLYKDFYNFTGMGQDQVFFCRERHEKQGISAKLELDIFIDDRFTVLEHLLRLEHIDRLFLFDPLENERQKFLAALFHRDKRRTSPVVLVDNWQDLMSQIRM